MMSTSRFDNSSPSNILCQTTPKDSHIERTLPI